MDQDARVPDVCIVGAGPVGLTCALEAAERGVSVLLLEAGPQDPRRGRPGPPPGTSVASSPASHAPPALTNGSGLGGTSSLWGGRCVPMEAADLAERAHVPHSGWPLPLDELTAWYPAAARALDCGSDAFRTAPLPGAASPVLVTTQQERLARNPEVLGTLGARALAHPCITVLVGAVVTALQLTPDGSRVLGVVVRHPGAPTGEVLMARAVVLACGGLGTTRLLLEAQHRFPQLAGGSAGALGRFYAGHLTGTIADVVLARPQDADLLDYRLDETRTWVRRRLTLSPTAQGRESLLNIAFWIGTPALGDPRHGSPGLSLLRLLVAVVQALRGNAVGGAVQGEPGASPEAHRVHLRRVLRHPVAALRELAAMTHRRRSARPSRRKVLVRVASGRYALRYHAEHAPHPDSRVRLDGTLGPDGLPGLTVDLRYSAQDADSVVRAHDVLGAELLRVGLGMLEHRYPAERRREAVLQQASDGYHQLGTTRMSRDPSKGVVDTDCAMHGVTGLFVASTSVFTTSGEANPTFTAVALAARLGAHLARLRVHADPVDVEV